MEKREGLTIATCELRDVFERLLAHLESQNGEAVTLTEDYFYSIPVPDIYNVHRSAPEPTVGQLTESWAHIQGREADSTVTFEFVWFGDLMKAIGHLAR
jgi:hypothetical protein